MTEEPSKALEGYFHQKITFFHCPRVQWTRCFAIAIHCFFILSVRSGFMAALRQGKPESFWRQSCIVQNETFWSSTGCRFFTSSAVNWGFVWISILKKVSAAYEVFLLLQPPNLCFGTASLDSHLAEDKSFIMLDPALLLRLHVYFFWYFFLLQARIQAFSSLLLYFPGMLKWYFKKQTLHWRSVLNYLLCSKTLLPEWCVLIPEDLNSPILRWLWCNNTNIASFRSQQPNDQYVMWFAVNWLK